jgi:hypothetical protein
MAWHGRAGSVCAPAGGASCCAPAPAAAAPPSHLADRLHERGEQHLPELGAHAEKGTFRSPAGTRHDADPRGACLPAQQSLHAIPPFAPPAAPPTLQAADLCPAQHLLRQQALPARGRCLLAWAPGEHRAEGPARSGRGEQGGRGRRGLQVNPGADGAAMKGGGGREVGRRGVAGKAGRGVVQLAMHHGRQQAACTHMAATAAAQQPPAPTMTAGSRRCRGGW